MTRFEYVSQAEAIAAFERGERVETPFRECVIDPLWVSIEAVGRPWSPTWRYRIVREVPEADTPEVAPASPAYRMRLLCVDRVPTCVPTDDPQITRCIEDVEATYAVIGQPPLEINDPTPYIETLRKERDTQAERADKAVKELAAVNAELTLVRTRLDSAKATVRREQTNYQIAHQAQIRAQLKLDELRSQIMGVADAH